MKTYLIYPLFLCLCLFSVACFFDEAPDAPSDKVFNEPEWTSISTFPYNAIWGIGFGIEAYEKAYVGMTYGVFITQDGFVTGGFNKNFFSYDPKTNKWDKLKDFPGIPTNYPVGFSIGNKGYYLAGGGKFWEYDPLKDDWASKKDYPDGDVDAPVAFSIGSKGYVGLGKRNKVGYEVPAIWEYDPLTNDWMPKDSLITTDSSGYRSGAVAFSIGNRGYVTCGHTYFQKGNRREKNFPEDLWEFDPTASKKNQWKRLLKGIPKGREGGVSFVINGKAYVGGGSDKTTTLKDFWEFDPLSGDWKSRPDLGNGLGRSFSTAFSLNNKGYFGLGSFDADVTLYRYSNDFYVFTPFSSK